MKSTTDRPFSVDAVLNLKKSGMLVVNAEYQRGEVWKLAQRKRLVDSVLRGYTIPLFYFHYIKREVEGFAQERFEVIDGQQRLDALYFFKEGQFKLFDPVKDEAKARFPAFVKEQPCPWGGKAFADLTPELQQQFLNTPLPVVMIETQNQNEVRDLFIRSGRDAAEFAGKARCVARQFHRIRSEARRETRRATLSRARILRQSDEGKHQESRRVSAILRTDIHAVPYPRKHW